MLAKGELVCELAFFFDNSSLIPANFHSFIPNIDWTKEQKQTKKMPGMVDLKDIRKMVKL